MSTRRMRRSRRSPTDRPPVYSLAGSPPTVKLGTKIAARFVRHGLDRDLPELRGQAPRAARFDD